MFFGELMEELEKVVGCFNTRAQELLQLHLASGFRKFLLYLTSSNLDRAAMLQQGQSLVSYAFINATAVRKILKKYDKVRKIQFSLLKQCFCVVCCQLCFFLFLFLNIFFKYNKN